MDEVTEENTQQDLEQLGGNIMLVGFKEVDTGTIIVLKKIVGSFAKKLSELCTNFQGIRVTNKTVHKTPKSEKYEIHVHVTNDGKVISAETVDRNLFFALDKSLKSVETEILKTKE